MSDLMENIQKVMSDPESVKQLSQLAQSLGLGEQAPSGGFSGQSAKAEEQADFSKFLQNLTPPPQPTSPTPDITKLMEFSKLLETASKTDKNTELILALKPHLKAETQQKADRLVKIFKLLSVYPLLKDSGLLGGDFSGKP